MKKKKLIILGGGESGVGAAMLGHSSGYDVLLVDEGKISDQHKEELNNEGIVFHENGVAHEELKTVELIVKSPGIPENNELVKFARSQNIEIISEIEWAYRFKGDSKIVAITGSNGKTTTTSMIYHIVKEAGLNAAIVGNVGISFARQVATDPKELYIVEVSSFQLDDINSFRANIAILCNITEDHLDRYNYQFENYIHSKFRITEFQTSEDYFIYNEDDEVSRKYINQFLIKAKILKISMSNQLPEGAYLSNAEMHSKWENEEMKMSVEDFALKGKHNQYNTMASILSAQILGIRKEKIRSAVQTFESLAHRMTTVGTIKGVEFINDSKATNTNSTWYALESMTKPVILIMGGVDKGNDYSILKELVKEKVKAIVCLGTDNARILEAFKDDVSVMVETQSAMDAVNASFALAEKGDVVLLSPACASFDLFKNYEDRGNQFTDAVKEL